MIRDFIRDADTVVLVGFVRLMLGGPLSLALGFVAWLMGCVLLAGAAVAYRLAGRIPPGA